MLLKQLKGIIVHKIVCEKLSLKVRKGSYKFIQCNNQVRKMTREQNAWMIYLLDFLQIIAIFETSIYMYLRFGISFPRKIIQFYALETDLVLNLCYLLTSCVTNLLGIHLASSNNNGTRTKKGLIFLR